LGLVCGRPYGGAAIASRAFLLGGRGGGGEASGPFLFSILVPILLKKCKIKENEITQQTKLSQNVNSFHDHTSIHSI
jgi:hypothetical protein